MPRSNAESIPEFGANLKRLRKARGLSRQELADRIRATVGYVEKLEANRINPYLSVAVRLADALKIRLEKFLEKSPEKSK